MLFLKNFVLIHFKLYHMQPKLKFFACTLIVNVKYCMKKLLHFIYSLKILSIDCIQVAVCFDH